ncbi:MAG: RICIN domain-containing protein, partial [Clostridia bacterium]|nr:RICIN domain-containing protein [Clostridia bacterium]
MPLLEDGFVYRIEDPAWFALAGDEFGAAENAEVVTQATNDDLNQLWRVHGADGGVLLENLSAGLYLTVKADAKTEGALLCLASR